jgi:hypothetical protein
MLRNFQLKFTPDAFAAESEAWRAVIDLNLVRSVTYILDVLGAPGSAQMPDELRRLRVALSPLRSVETALARFIANDERSNGSKESSGPRLFDVRVGSGSRWKTLFKRNAFAHTSREYVAGYDEVLNARRVIEACKDELMALWAHPVVRENLEEQSVSLQFQSGLYVSRGSSVIEWS